MNDISIFIPFPTLEKIKVGNWYVNTKRISLIYNLNHSIANRFRKRFVRGFINIGGCNYYLGLLYDNLLIGVLGFSNPDMGNYDIMLKADTVINYEYLSDLLLYLLRTKDVHLKLCEKFNRKINTAYSMCFTENETINRYRRHAKLIKKKNKPGGYDLGYLFELNTIPSVKSAIKEWQQKNKIN